MLKLTMDPWMSESLSQPDESVSLSPIWSRFNLKNDNHDKQWEAILSKLEFWGLEPKQFEEYELTPPTKKLVSEVWRTLNILRKQAETPPSSVSTDPNGSIVVEWRNGESLLNLYFWDDNIIELIRFEDAKVKSRLRLK